MLISAKPWPAIVAFYRDFGAQWTPMAALAERIAGGWHGQLLHGYTSMTTLVIGVTPLLIHTDDVVHLAFDPQLRRFAFAYWENAAGKACWQHVCLAEEGWPVFIRFVALRRWLTVDPAALEAVAP